MYALGYSINVLTLLGLVLAIGLVVDDAIVVLENIHRRTELGEPPLVAAVKGAREIGFAVIATTLTLVAVFVPISFLPGDLGPAVPRVRLHARGRRAVLGADRAHAHADARVEAAASTSTATASPPRSIASSAARELLRAPPAQPDPPPVAVVAVLAGADRRRRPHVPLPAERVRAAGRRRPRVHRPSKRRKARASNTSTATRASSKPSCCKRWSVRRHRAHDGARAGQLATTAHRRRELGARVPRASRTGTSASAPPSEIMQPVLAEARKLPGVRVSMRPARRSRAAAAQRPCSRRHRRAGLRAASQCGPTKMLQLAQANPGLANVETQLQGAQAADPRVHRSQPRGGPRRLARDASGARSRPCSARASSRRTSTAAASTT